MATLELEHINKTYPNGYVAIKDVNIHIASGEFVVIVGASGCGKSTLMRMVAGLESITGGTLKISGEVANKKEPADRNIAMVFQNYALYPHMNVFDNMAYGLKIRHIAKAEIKQRIEDAAAMLGLSQLLDRKPKQLSGGQRQRVAMGRAIVRHPDVFLFDEPLSNLDAKLRVQMRLEIQKLHHKYKTTSLYVTHDQVEAMTLADRIIVLNQGLVEQIGTPDEIFHTPATTFVAQFMGMPPMNLIQVDIDAQGKIMHEDGKEIPLSLSTPKSLYQQKAWLGMRPEHMVIDDTGLRVTVEMIETLGSEQLIHVRYKEQLLIVRCASSYKHLHLGDIIFVSYDSQIPVHWFNAENGHRVNADSMDSLAFA